MPPDGRIRQRRVQVQRPDEYCVERIREYTAGDQSRFVDSGLVQDAVIRNLQTLTESSQCLSDNLKATEPQVPWREVASFCNVTVHGL